MKLRVFLMVGVAAVVGFGLALAATGAAKPENTWTAPQMIGRYQMVPVTGVHVHVCDTTTGEIWTNNDGAWTAKGKPPATR